VREGKKKRREKGEKKEKKRAFNDFSICPRYFKNRCNG
jgi:hypothetical protein